MEDLTGAATLICDGEDVDGLAGLSHQVRSDGSLRNRLRVAGLKRASLFSWESCVNETIQVYKGL